MWIRHYWWWTDGIFKMIEAKVIFNIQSKRWRRSLANRERVSMQNRNRRLLRLERVALINQTGEYPGSTIMNDYGSNSVGDVNLSGDSEFAARANHVHKGVTIVTTNDATMDSGDGNIGSLGISRNSTTQIPWLKSGASTWIPLHKHFTTLDADGRDGDTATVSSIGYQKVGPNWRKNTHIS